MKKMFLTMTLAFVTMFASAQFMVMTTMTEPADGEQWGMSNITEKIGVGYMLNDKMTLGVVKNGDVMDMWGRYNLSFAWLTMQAPTDSTMMDNMNIGIGYSLRVWNEMYVEPSYTVPMKANSEGNREGKMRLGLSYKF
jgi:opacity protein-like surface antigen